MSTTFVTQPFLDNHVRPMWEVERASDGRSVVRVGEVRFNLSEIASVSAGIEQTRHRHGRVVAMLLFGIVASLYLIGILQFGVHSRFLLAVFICFSLALMSLQDVILVRPQRLAVFDIRLKDGRHIRWATADVADAAALNAVLAGRD